MKRKVKWLLAGVILLISGSAYAYSVLKPVPVEAETLKPDDMANRFTVQGTVVPEDSVILNAAVGGEILELPAREGELVEEGSLVARIGGGGQTSQELSREQYRQQLANAKQQYESLFGSGGLAAARENAAQSAYNQLKKQYDNALVLSHEGGYISQAELDEMKAQLDQAKQQLAEAKEGNSAENRAYYQNQIASSERQLAALEETIKEETISMPYDGIMWENYVGIGAYVTQNQQIARIYRPGALKIQASLLSEDAVLLSEGDTAKLTFSDQSEADGSIRFISQVAKQTLSSIGMEENRCTVELKPSMLPEGIGAGYQTDVTFTLIAARQVISVPVSAIVPIGEGNGVFRIDGKKAALVPVETGVKSGGRIEIITGVEAGNVIVSDPYGDSVKEGSRVEAQP